MTAAITLVDGANGAHDAPAGLAQLPGLGAGQRVEDQASDLLDVAGRGLCHLRSAPIGQGRQGVSPVGRIVADPEGNAFDLVMWQ